MRIDLMKEWADLTGIESSADQSIPLVEPELVDLAASTVMYGPFGQDMITAVQNKVWAPRKVCVGFHDATVQADMIYLGEQTDVTREVDVVATIVQPGIGVFGHWLIDILPKLACLSRLATDKPIHVLARSHSEPIGARFTRVAKALDERIVLDFVHDDEAVRAKMCFVLPVLRQGNAFASGCLAYFNLAAAAAKRTSRRTLSLGPKAVISRSEWGDHRRELLNRPAVEELMSSRGFSIVKPELHRVEDMITAMQDVNILAGERGSGLHYAAFSDAVRTTVVLVSGRGSFTGMEIAQSGLCHLRGQTAIMVAGEPLDLGLPPTDEPPPPTREEFTVSLEILEHVLDCHDVPMHAAVGSEASAGHRTAHPGLLSGPENAHAGELRPGLPYIGRTSHLDDDLRGSRVTENPVLIIGFHHSGTRLLARQLAAMGIFQVMDDGPAEWTFIQRLNERLCPPWCKPASLRSWMNAAHTSTIDTHQVSDGLVEHGFEFGNWGIKDPRLCLTAHLWSEVYPRSRSVIIYRDPLTVLGTFPEVYSFFTPEKQNPLDQIGFWADLYDLYYTATRRHVVQSSESLEVRFEDLTSNPEMILRRIGAFLRIENLDQAVETAIKQVVIDGRPSRRIEAAIESGQISQWQIQAILQRTAHIRRELGYDDV